MKLLSTLMNWLISMELFALLGLIIAGAKAAARGEMFLGGRQLPLRSEEVISGQAPDPGEGHYGDKYRNRMAA